MGNRINPGCGGCGGCQSTQIYPTWTDWTNPPVSDGDVIAAGESPSIIHPRPTGNWIVDIEVTNSTGTEGSITVGNIVVEFYDDSLRIAMGTCGTQTMPAGSYWLRFVEVSESDGEDSPTITRHLIAQIWNIHPDSPSATLTHAECVDLTDPDVVDEVTITIAPETTSITINSITVSDTIEESADCPEPTCVVASCASGGPPTYITTAVRVMRSGALLDWVSFEQDGEFQDTRTNTKFTGVWEQYFSIDLTETNGTWIYKLWDTDTSTFVDPLLVDGVLDSLRTGRICADNLTRYVWKTPEISITPSYTYLFTTSDGSEIYPPYYYFVSTSTYTPASPQFDPITMPAARAFKHAVIYSFYDVIFGKPYTYPALKPNVGYRILELSAMSYFVGTTLPETVPVLSCNPPTDLSAEATHAKTHSSVSGSSGGYSFTVTKDGTVDQTLVATLEHDYAPL